MNAAPLGVFDSGIGGLTVAHALFECLPHESVIYFGDTARVPYGPKSPETVRRYSGEILDLLVRRGVKMVVVACNTSTAHALDFLRARSPLSARLGIGRPPPVAWVDRPSPMLFCTGVLHPAVVVSRGAVALLDPEELRAALAHELNQAPAVGGVQSCSALF